MIFLKKENGYHSDPSNFAPSSVHRNMDVPWILYDSIQQDSANELALHISFLSNGMAYVIRHNYDAIYEDAKFAARNR